MSKPRYDWWPYVKGMIRRYPQLKEEYKELHYMRITPGYSCEPQSNEVARTLENIALRELPQTKQREYLAVHKAIETTKRYRNGADRLKIIKLVLWDRSHTLEGAAMVAHCSIVTAWRWHSEFIRLVASYYGLMDD